MADQDSWKYIGVEFDPMKNDYPTIIPMDSMQVASWWLVEQHIPIRLSSPEFDKVMSLEISTGNGILAGHYQLQLEKIIFSGKWLNSR